MGYSKESKAYWLYDLSKQEVIIWSYVIFLWQGFKFYFSFFSLLCFSTWLSIKFRYIFKGEIKIIHDLS